MARIQRPPKGRLIVSIIYNSLDGLADSLKLLEKQFGRVQCETMELTYTSGSYAEEMGDNLQRRFYSFERLVATACPKSKRPATKWKINWAIWCRIMPFGRSTSIPAS
jgi:hypothetical protein